MNEDEDGDENEIEVHPDTSSKKRANNATESSTSKKSKKYVQLEDSNILNKLIRELSSDTTRLSEIKERRGLQREAVLEVESDQTLFNLYLKIANAEKWNEKVRNE